MSKKGLSHLQKDRVMRKLIAEYEPPKRGLSSGLFADLVFAVVNQQLSDKAAATIMVRIKETVGEPLDPRVFLRMTDAKLRKAGISFSKVSYIKGISQAAIDGKLVEDKLRRLSDEEVLREMTNLKGIGPWTAEMILMFTLKRPDVFSIGDLGLRTAIAKLYGVDRDDTERILKISARWKPYRSLACWYLWKYID